MFNKAFKLGALSLKPPVSRIGPTRLLSSGFSGSDIAYHDTSVVKDTFVVPKYGVVDFSLPRNELKFLHLWSKSPELFEMSLLNSHMEVFVKKHGVKLIAKAQIVMQQFSNEKRISNDIFWYRHIANNLKWRTVLEVKSERDDDGTLWLLMDINLASGGWLFLPVSKLNVPSVPVASFYGSSAYHSLPPSSVDCLTAVKSLVDQILGPNNNHKTEVMYSDVDNHLYIAHSDAARQVKIRVHIYAWLPEAITSEDLQKHSMPEEKKRSFLAMG